jgi:hypothetical protein
MKENVVRKYLVAACAALAIAASAGTAGAHHSFAMYDQAQTRTYTGKLTRYIPGSNHAQLIFELVGPDGKPIPGKDGKPSIWGVETASAVAMARVGVSPKTFPNGTIFSVTLFPLRDGRPFGAMAGMLIRCGMTVPAGGCTKETGEVLVVENN